MEMPDVVLSEQIEEEWGNAIRDRTAQRYDDATTRATESPSPTVGDLAFMQDSGDLDIYYAGAWRHVGAQVGSVQMLAGGAAPPGWLVCNGQAVSRTTYAALFAQIGTAWGVGDGTTTFNLPDMRGRVPRGVAASGAGDAVGETFGADTHVHTGPSHAHSNPATASDSHAHTQGATGAGGGHSHTLESGFAKWAHSATVNFFKLITTETWGLNRTNDPDGPLMPTPGSGNVTSGTELGGDTGAVGSHTHTNPNTASDAHSHTQGNTGAGGTGNTGSASTIQAGAALTFIIRH